MKRLRSLLQKKEGTTLVETMVCLLLISIMLAMAASALSAASRIFVRVQRTQYAQSILDTAMTELRTITQNASGYVKIYDIPAASAEKSENITENITESTGKLRGNTVEFINEEGYVVLVSTNGCEDTDLYIQNNRTGLYKLNFQYFVLFLLGCCIDILCVLICQLLYFVFCILLCIFIHFFIFLDSLVSITSDITDLNLAFFSNF